MQDYYLLVPVKNEVVIDPTNNCVPIMRPQQHNPVQIPKSSCVTIRLQRQSETKDTLKETSCAKDRIMISSSRWNTTPATVVNAPICVVWESLSDIQTWRRWNMWVRLDAGDVASGAYGKARILNGKKRWIQRDFRFVEVSRKTFTFSWTTKISLGKCTNTIRLVPLGLKQTELRHSQVFEGASPAVGFGLNYKRMKEYPLFINEALKLHVEQNHFNYLLHTYSSRDMAMSSSCTLDTEDTSEPATYWETPPHVREKLVSSFLGGNVSPTNSRPIQP